MLSRPARLFKPCLDRFLFSILDLAAFGIWRFAWVGFPRVHTFTLEVGYAFRGFIGLLIRVAAM